MNHLRVFLCLFLSTAALFATSNNAHARENRDVLSQSFAEARSAQISQVEYFLRLKFAPKATGFQGHTQIHLQLKRLDQDLSIDAKLTKIESVLVNGQKISDFILREGSFDIPAKYLNPYTIIDVDYFNEYSEDGQGLMRFTDPADAREYLYSDNEPYGAHTFFPCIDQPDQRAHFTVEMELPAAWKALNNSLPAEETPSASGASKTVRFQRTEKISSYLLFVGGGEFHAWQDSWNGKPLYLYARESLKDSVDVEEIFSITKKGLTFYSDYFGYAYPFPQYSHVFCPDLGPGAMENPGIVTMNERMIFRGPQPEGSYMDRANTILHEMAHHWFGDLVTMRWWDDLWLNESFATYMAHLSLDRALNMGEKSWTSFVGEKNWARWQDQLSTTHPIVGNIPDTDASGASFDGITYGKGAAVLKQMHFYVGETAFQKGVQDYFKNYAWTNTQRKNFVDSIAAAAGTNLDGWSKGWLETAGLNRVRANWACSEGRISRFTLEQDPSVSSQLLDHRSRIGFYAKTRGSLAAVSTIDIAYGGRETEVSQAIGAPCPDFVYLNADDKDYAIFELDPISQNFAQENILAFSDPTLRNMLWSGLNQTISDLQLDFNSYFRLFSENAPKENDFIVLGMLLGRHGDMRSYLAGGILAPEERDRLLPTQETIAWQAFNDAPTASSKKYYWLDHFIELAHSPDALAKIRGLFNSGGLDKDRRWRILVRLSAHGAQGIGDLVNSELAQDPSDQAQKSALAAKVAAPELDSKWLAWKEFINPESSLSTGMRRVATAEFHNADHPELSRPFVVPFFEMVKNYDWSQEMFDVRSTFENLFPYTVCEQDVLALSRANLTAQWEKLPNHVRRAWMEANDSLEKCIQIRARNQQRR